MKSLYAEYNKKNSEFTLYAANNGPYIGGSKTKDLNRLRKNALNHKISLISIADDMYYRSLISKKVLEFDQSKMVIVKAANYNPRNLKESYVVQDYIDSVYEFMNLTESNE